MIQKTAALKELNNNYKQPGNQLVVFYGREGCGKELYIRNFLKGKEFFYYRACEVSDEEQEMRFAKKVEKQFHLDSEEKDYRIYFEKMKSSGQSKLVVVLDEFEHLMKKNSVFLENILRLKRNKSEDGSVMILLCSSSLVFVEHKMTAVLGKAFYEIDVIHKIQEMTFIDIVRSFPENSVRECIEIFGVIGGIPAYLKEWDGKKSLKENICGNILSPNSGLFLEAEHYLRTELRELSVYNTILTAMAGGCRKLNELHKYTGYSRAKVSVYLKHLMEFEVVEKVVSFETGGWENAQKGIYQIKNTLLHFWFRFVFPNLSDLYLYTPETFYEMHIAGALDSYLEYYFRQVCMEYIKLMNRAKKLPIQIHKLGTWIGKQGNIDIIAQNSVRENIVGICRWSQEGLTRPHLDELEELMKKARIGAKHYFLFSGSSFDDELKELAQKDDRITLIDLADL